MRIIHAKFTINPVMLVENHGLKPSGIKHLSRGFVNNPRERCFIPIADYITMND